MMDSLRALSLSIQNFMRVECAELRFERGGVVVVGGNNGSGKTSVLRAIEVSLGGMRLAPGEPVRRGSQEAEIILVLGEDNQPVYRIERTFTADGQTSLTVTDATGKAQRSPQRLLDAFLGDLSFDPLAFGKMKPAEQASLVARMAGVDITTHGEHRARLLEARLLAGRKAKDEESRWENMPAHADVAKPVDPTDLVRQLTVADHHDAEIRKLEGQVSDRLSRADQCGREPEIRREQIKELKCDIERLQERIAQLEAELVQQLEEEKSERAKAAEIQQVLDDKRTAAPDRSAIEADLSASQEVNTKYAENQARAKQAELVFEARQAHEESDAALRKHDQHLALDLANAKLPLTDLGFNADGVVTYKGIELNQASSAEALRVSLAMGAAINPVLRTVLVREGSLLDETQLALVASFAQEHGLQVFLEMVGDKGSTIVLEEGKVRQVAGS